MNPILSTMENRGETAVRLNVPGMAQRWPWLVDEWLITPPCGHSDCQVVVSMGSLADDRNVAGPVGGILRHYSHMLFLSICESVGQPLTAELLFNDSPDQRLAAKLVPVFQHPIAVPDDERARAICHQLVRDVVANVLPMRPESETQVSTWQLAIVMALLANHTPNGHEARIDPRKTETVEPLGAGFGIHPRRERAGWTGQEPEKERNHEHG